MEWHGAMAVAFKALTTGTGKVTKKKKPMKFAHHVQISHGQMALFSVTHLFLHHSRWRS